MNEATSPGGDGHDVIWTKPQRGRRGPRPEHSRDEIARTAVALADTSGLGAVTMRAVADALGTAAGSLYRYLSSRDDLVDLMVDAVLAELPLDPSPDGWWLDDMVALARDQLALHRRHSWLVEAFPSTGPFGPRATDLFEHQLRTLAPVIRPVSTKMEAIAMVAGVVSLFARTRSAGTERPPAPTSLFPTADVAAHPHLLTAFAQPDPSPPSADLFDRTIRSVLNGLLTDAAPPVGTGSDGT